jgi:hypothetical protein
MPCSRTSSAAPPAQQCTARASTPQVVRHEQAYSRRLFYWPRRNQRSTHDAPPGGDAAYSQPASHIVRVVMSHIQRNKHAATALVTAIYACCMRTMSAAAAVARAAALVRTGSPLTCHSKQGAYCQLPPVFFRPFRCVHHPESQLLSDRSNDICPAFAACVDAT